MVELKAHGPGTGKAVGGFKKCSGAVISCPPLFVSPKMEKEVSDFIQDSGQIKKKFQPMNKIERSIL